jgi:murein DD-endopeptidase MepM/ murein hydrolase activator NlpD
LDFRVKTGTPVVAAANGKIISAGWEGSYGYQIQIDHGSGYITTYSHLSKITFSSGEVAAGKEIGKSGSSGNTTGPHLHFEVIKDGEFINPSKWLWGN